MLASTTISSLVNEAAHCSFHAGRLHCLSEVYIPSVVCTVCMYFPPGNFHDLELLLSLACPVQQANMKLCPKDGGGKAGLLLSAVLAF